jgi:hypothetical protein
MQSYVRALPDFESKEMTPIHMKLGIMELQGMVLTNFGMQSFLNN